MSALRSGCCPVIAFGVMLLCLGCAEERPTRPVGQISLRAMNLNDNPVLEVSDTVVAIAVNDTDFVIPLAGLPLVQQGREDEIQIVFRYGWGRPYRDPSFYDYTSNAWRVLEGLNAGPRCNEECSWYGRRLLSQVDLDFKRSLISGTHKLTLEIPAGGDPRVSAWAVRFHPEYQFITVNTQFLSTLDCLTDDGTSIWLLKWLYSGEPPEGDSVIQLDHQGNRVSGFWLPDYRFMSMTYGGGAFWVLWQSGVGKLSSMDNVGALSSTFDIVLPRGWWPLALAWVRESLWLLSESGDGPNSTVDSLFEVDIPASVATGSAQFRRRFEIPRKYEYFAIAGGNEEIMVWNTDSYAHSRSLLRYDLSGSLIDSLALPVAPGSGMAWDGESLWMLHHGPPEAYTDATLLSRFHIP
ncbi:MAG: hypothetical protein HY304_00825 [candidate division Zixibacteria bacterium]|nr:hypothetical protein [candidate division Zixibacteria bacterium]